MSNYSTKNHATYINIRLVRDAKFFEASGDRPAATYVTFVHSTKGQDADIFIDARIVRGAKLMAGLRKGDIINGLHGELNFKIDKQGDLRGVMYDVNVVTSVNLKERQSEVDVPTPTADAEVDGAGGADASGDAPAFD